MEEIKKGKYDIPNILVISGVSGPQKEELQKNIKNRNLEKNITLAGFVSNEEKIH